MERKKLSDILQHNSDRETLSSLWKTTAAAAEFAPLPKGEYNFRVLSSELFNSKRNATPGYKLTLEVYEGEYEGRRAWVDFWLTPAALPMTKRDLLKLGVIDLAQLERPLPPGILIKGKLALKRDDDGNEVNKMVRFEFVGIEPGDAFAPTDDQLVVATDFPFGANVPTGGGAVGKPGSDATPPAGTNGEAQKRTRRRKAKPTGTEGGANP